MTNERTNPASEPTQNMILRIGTCTSETQNDVLRDSMPSDVLDSGVLMTLTQVVNQVPYGSSIKSSEFRQLLYAGGKQQFRDELEQSCIEANEERAQALAQYNAFVDDLVRLSPPSDDNKPLPFERWLKRALKRYIEHFEIEDWDERLLLETEWWGLKPSDSEEQRVGIPLTRLELSEFGSSLTDLPTTERKLMVSGRNDCRSFQAKGTSLTVEESWMLRRLGILPKNWDNIYGAIVEKTADQFVALFYPVFRWIVLDPDETSLSKDERITVELLPGFQALFSTFIKDVLTVAVNQTLQYSVGQSPGTGQGMREFAYRSAADQEKAEE